MTKDALGNEIVIGKNYGYTINSNGHIQVVTGKAKSVNELKVTLSDVQERSGVYGVPKEFKPEKRNRSAYGCNMFPVIVKIDDETIKTAGNDWALKNADATMATNSALNRGFVGGANYMKNA